MLKLHPEFFRREGDEQFVVLPYREFVELQELLEDFLDLKDLQDARAASAGKPTLTSAQVKQRYGITE